MDKELYTIISYDFIFMPISNVVRRTQECVLRSVETIIRYTMLYT